ncbi:hypothetical protein DFJ73DRAFT_957179 [Zopfochytrium polystomum]|nr:hypothetical protein DFJ73DRAFT_957179 [Zopfochytrium polystomum]
MLPTPTTLYMLSRGVALVLLFVASFAVAMLAAAAVESELHEWQLPRPPDPVSFYIYARSLFLTAASPCLAHAYLLDAGVRRRRVVCGLWGMTIVSVVLLLASVALLPDATAVLAVTPFLRIPGLSIFIYSIQFQSASISSKVIKSVFHGSVQSAFEVAALWIWFGYFTVSEHSGDQRQPGYIFATAFLVLASALCQNLQIQYLTIVFKRGQEGQSGQSLNTLGPVQKSLRTLEESILTAKTNLTGEADEPEKRSIDFVRLMNRVVGISGVYQMTPVIVILRTPEDNVLLFSFFAALLIIAPPLLNSAMFSWKALKSARSAGRGLNGGGARGISQSVLRQIARRNPYLFFHEIVVQVAATLSGVLQVALFFSHDTPLQRLPDACRTRLESTSVLQTMERGAALVAGGLCVAGATHWVRTWLKAREAWRKRMRVAAGDGNGVRGGQRRHRRRRRESNGSAAGVDASAGPQEQSLDGLPHPMTRLQMQEKILVVVEGAAGEEEMVTLAEQENSEELAEQDDEEEAETAADDDADVEKRDDFDADDEGDEGESDDAEAVGFAPWLAAIAGGLSSAGLGAVAMLFLRGLLGTSECQL